MQNILISSEISLARGRSISLGKSVRVSRALFGLKASDNLGPGLFLIKFAMEFWSELYKLRFQTAI